MDPLSRREQDQQIIDLLLGKIALEKRRGEEQHVFLYSMPLADIQQRLEIGQLLFVGLDHMDKRTTFRIRNILLRFLQGTAIYFRADLLGRAVRQNDVHRLTDQLPLALLEKILKFRFRFPYGHTAGIAAEIFLGVPAPVFVLHEID